ncbi:hypothetical protein GCM10028818_55050 [Spirosoma horti]
MNKDSFLFTDRIKQIKSSFIRDGWVTVYESINERYEDEILICCGIVSSSQIDEYREDKEWKVRPGSEGKPSIISSMVDGKWASRYYTYDEDSLEPFLFSKSFRFDNKHESYIDIGEEFVLYFRLYEKGTDKQNRKYYFIDDAGDLDEAIIIEPEKVKIKLKYLKEYLAVRQIYFSICFDFVRYIDIKIIDSDIKPLDEDFKEANYIYNHYIRPSPSDISMLQGWIRGKIIIDYDKSKTESHHFDSENYQYADFITGYDDDGNELLESCKKSDEKYFKLTYFKKEVLNKYYYDPGKYTVDGFSVSSNFFSLKIDNNIGEYVAVFLVDLSSLPYKEQLHWKHYNITPQKGMSHTYYRTMIEGNWAEHSETADLFFKDRYNDFNKKWQKKFGWELYKTLSEKNEHNFKSLHVPTTNNVKAFCEQILSLVIITIDSLNEKEISKGFETEEKISGSINKLDRFLKSKGVDIPPMIEFLRNLQNLRSGLVAHRFSESNDSVKKTMKYFNLNDDNYMQVAEDIFVSSILTMNTLENRLLNVETQADTSTDGN